MDRFTLEIEQAIHDFALRRAACATGASRRRVFVERVFAGAENETIERHGAAFSSRRRNLRKILPVGFAR
jgi:hypothetical protein